MTNNGRRLRLALFALCLGAVFFGGTVIWTLSNRVNQIQTVEQSDPLWIVSQLQFEFLRFNAELAQYVFAPETADDLRTRFDILWSRMNMMRQGKIADLIDTFGLDRGPLLEFQKTLDLVDPFVQALPGEGSTEQERRDAVKAIAVPFAKVDLEIREFSLSLAQEKARYMAEFRSGLLSLSSAVGYLGIVILALAGIFFTMLMLDIRANKNKARQLQKMIAEVNASARMKENFMSIVSHELRTPLTSIIGGLSMLRKVHGEKMERGAYKMLDIAYRNSERLLSLVNDILDAQSLSEGKVTLHREEANLVQIAAETMEQCEAYAQQYEVECVFEAPDDTLPVYVDSGRISQVMSNFLSNAIKFSGKGKTVEIRVRRMGDNARVAIVDHGRGIPQSEHDNLFRRFHQVDPGTTGPGKSSGLGLNISKQLIEMHDGEVGFRSVEGRGSIFWFTVPCHDAPTVEISAKQDLVDA